MVSSAVLEASTARVRGAATTVRPGKTPPGLGVATRPAIRVLSVEEHRRFLDEQPSASFLQCPSWAEVKPGWTSESLGWIDESGDVVGAALVLYRQMPLLRRYMAYLPEGPVLPWAGNLSDWLDPMLAHLRARKVFSVKMGPPLVLRRWNADTVKEAAQSGGAAKLEDVPADVCSGRALWVAERLTALGWQRSGGGVGTFGDYQPRYVFEVPLAGRSLAEVRSGLAPAWRRNVAKGEKAGVEVVEGGYDDLPAFHALLQVTGRRDGFSPRPLAYFQRQWRALVAEDPTRMRLFLARHQGELLAAGTMITVGEHVWYQSGASADSGREVRPSNLLQWRMIEEAHSQGAAVYDMRGIGNTLDQSSPLWGLTRFKLGTGGQAAENLGEWDYALSPVLHRALKTYLRRR